MQLYHGKTHRHHPETAVTAAEQPLLSPHVRIHGWALLHRHQHLQPDVRELQQIGFSQSIIHLVAEKEFRIFRSPLLLVSPVFTTWALPNCGKKVKPDYDGGCSWTIIMGPKWPNSYN